MQVCSQKRHTGKKVNKRRYLWDVPYSPGSIPLKRDNEVIHRKWAGLLLKCISWLLEKHPLSLGQANPLIDLILSSSNSTWPFGLYSPWLVLQTSLSPVIQKRAIISAHFALVSGILERVDVLWVCWIMPLFCILDSSKVSISKATQNCDKSPGIPSLNRAVPTKEII